MKKKKIYFLSLFLFFLINNIYADNPSIFDYVPKTSGYLNLNDGFSVQIIGDGATYNVFNNLNGQVDQIAWKANKEYVYIIVRLRGWNNENNAQYYLIVIDGRKTKAKGTAYLLSEIPDLSDYHLNQAFTNDSSINLRSESSVNGKKLGQYQINNTVYFTGKMENKTEIDNANDYWFSIDYFGQPAWIYGKYVTFSKTLSITLESLGVIDSQELNKDEKINLKPIHNMELKCIYSTDESLYNIHQDDNIIVKIERPNIGYDSQYNIFIQKDDKKIAEIKNVINSVYSSKSNKLFYMKYMGGGMGSSLHYIDCNTGLGGNLSENLYTIGTKKSGLYPMYSQMIFSEDFSSVFFAEYCYGYWDNQCITIVEFDVETNEIINSYYSEDYRPTQFQTFGKLNDKIFYFVTNPRNSEEKAIVFFKIEGKKLVEIEKININDIDYKYEDSVLPINLPDSNIAIITFFDFSNNKTLVLEYVDGKIIINDSKINGVIYTTLTKNDEVYLLSIEKNDEGIVRIYDSKCNEILSTVSKYAKKGAYEQLAKAGFNSDGNITVMFEMFK